jgi:arylsulfatase A-like enzyme
VIRSRPSLVLVTVDCLRADHCGFLGYTHPTTPFLDTLSPESWVFRNAIVAGIPTFYSLPSILASRYPLALGRDVVGLAPDEPTLVSVLKEEGYATACFAAANPYVSRQFGYDHAFDTFHDFLDAESNCPARSIPLPEDENNLPSRANQKLDQLCHRLGLGPIYDELYFQYCQRLAQRPTQPLKSLRPFPTADVIVDNARDWLTGRDGQPFFLWLHLMDPHSPYYPPPENMEKIGNESATFSQARYLNAFWNRSDLGIWRLRRRRESMVKLYDAGIRWVDTQVRRLVEILRQSKLWDNCCFALTADHGEEFLEHGGRYHAPSKLTRELIHVPLLLRIPGAEQRVVNSPFSLLHLAPTVLDALGAPIPNAFRGTSYCRQIEARKHWHAPVLTECICDCKNPFSLESRMGSRLLAVRDRQYKLMIDFNRGYEHLFDLETDPNERSPLPRNKAAQTRHNLLKIAHAHVESSLAERNPRLRLDALLQDLKRSIMSQPLTTFNEMTARGA